MNSDATNQLTRPIRSFVLRQGRMSDAQARAINELGPAWLIPFSPQPINLSKAFNRDAPIVLEIGFGMGETTAQIALHSPDCNFLGVEVHRPGVGSLLRKIQEYHLNNVRIIQHDAVEVIEKMINEEALTGIHIYFPDPWPKKRHHKRRLIQKGLISTLSRKIKPGGYLHAATDWQEYAEQILEVMTQEPALENTAATFAARPEWRPQTKFEARGLKLGHGVWDILFQRSKPIIK